MQRRLLVRWVPRENPLLDCYLHGNLVKESHLVHVTWLVSKRLAAEEVWIQHSSREEAVEVLATLVHGPDHASWSLVDVVAHRYLEFLVRVGVAVHRDPAILVDDILSHGQRSMQIGATAVGWHGLYRVASIQVLVEVGEDPALDDAAEWKREIVAVAVGAEVQEPAAPIVRETLGSCQRAREGRIHSTGLHI